MRNTDMVTTTAPLVSRNAPATASWARAALVGILTVAAAVHLQLAGEHFESSAVMGAGFIGAAVAELGLAVAVLVRPRRLVYVGVIAVAAALIGMYGFNVMVGLPFQSGHLRETAAHGHAGAHVTEAPAAGHAATGHGAGGHSEAGLVVGSGEPIDALGGATKLGEMVAIGLSIMLLSRRSGARYAAQSSTRGQHHEAPLDPKADLPAAGGGAAARRLRARSRRR